MKIPEALETIWDESIESHFMALIPKHQDFLLAWVTNGYNGAQAYRTAYGQLETRIAESACASRLLSSANIRTIIDKLSETKAQDFIKVRQVYENIIEDYDASDADKIKAAQALAKLKGLEEPTKNERDLNDTLKNLTQEQIDKRLVELQRKVGISPIATGKAEAEGDEEA